MTMMVSPTFRHKHLFHREIVQGPVADQVSQGSFYYFSLKKVFTPKRRRYHYSHLFRHLFVSEIYIYETVMFDRVFALYRPCVYPGAVLRHASGPTGPRNSESLFVDQILAPRIVETTVLQKANQTEQNSATKWRQWCGKQSLTLSLPLVLTTTRAPDTITQFQKELQTIRSIFHAFTSFLVCYSKAKNPLSPACLNNLAAS